MSALATLPPTAKVRADPVPRIKAAGKIIATGGHNVDMIVRKDTYSNEIRGNLGTPEHIKKFRKTNNLNPGQIQVHPGLQEGLHKFPISHPYGRKSFASEHVNQVIKAQNLSGMADKFNDIKENKYASNYREPLGVSYQRGYQWPEQAQNGAIPFGVPTAESLAAKEVLYPNGGSLEEKQANTKMYQKTHGNFAPGEQRTREYDWTSNPRIQQDSGQNDPKFHPFGYGEQKLLNGAAKSVQPERIEESFPKTVIVKKIVEDQRAVAQDMLGTVKNLGQGQPRRDAEHTYGAQLKPQEWNAGKCIQGAPVERELAPDTDLGRSVKNNCTNQVRKSEDIDRAFGCPSIRTDIPFKTKKSVADYQNYGDEPEAVDLLFPATFTELGITEYDFQLPRSREAIKALFDRIGFNYKIGKFNTMYNAAKELCDARDDNVSVRAFMMAVNKYHHLE